ncbi:hypothetical protein SSX86_006218 [Deinandra increscens subsp. villosa]|uniref:Protein DETOXIFICATION n=1 Tax=Deinandra increscens subsp. villosa TaxID=3103831 RepID=A0AAP0HCM3_9ASTR
MSENTTPLIVNAADSGGGGGGDGDGWKKVVDWEEAKIQILFSLPMILTNVAYYAIPLTAVMFAGHLGEVELAASNLANSWATVTGFSFMVGLSGALETLCGQGFGAKLHRMLGIYLQSSCLISIFFSIMISILWFFTEPVLISLHQDPQISKMAALYIKHLIPGLFAYGILNNILRFLQTQSIVYPLVPISLIPLLLHIGITYVLVYRTSLAFVGAAVSVSVSLWIAVVILAGYAILSRKFKETWQGLSVEAFDHVVACLKLALPSAAMVCLEYWAFELLVLLAGVLPNSEITTSLIAMCVNTEAIAYMLTYGLSAAASTRVSNELGAGNIDRAKHAMAMTLKLSVLLSLAVVLALGFGHDIWASFFSNSHVIIENYASMTPLLMISIVLDSIQGVLSVSLMSEKTTPLIVNAAGGGGGGGGGGRWKKVVDREEAKIQILFSLPMILTNVAYYAIPLTAVMFAGHLGEVELAASNLANSWATVTGFSFMVGLSGALETLCGQGFGAKLHRMLGIYLQSSCLISIFFSIMISILWFFTEPVLISLHQDPQISKMAALYIKHLVPGLFAYGILNNILRFLQTQSIVYPLVPISLIPLILHIGITYVLVYRTSLAFVGAAVSVSVSLWIAVVILAGYAILSRKFKETWQGLSVEAFDHVVSCLKLALPSAAMVCLEYWAFELLVLLAGVLPNSEITTSLIAMCVNTEAIAYMLTYGLSAAASTRVSNELGAGNIDRAKHAMAMALKLSVLLSLAVVLALGFGHDIWASFFSDSHMIIESYASMTPFLMISIVLDSIQGVLSGVARGCGWQHLAVYINLAMFYFIGMPVAIALAFLLKLYAKGLWIGLICGLSCQTGSLLLLVYLNKWKRAELDGSNSLENMFLA